MIAGVSEVWLDEGGEARLMDRSLYGRDDGLREARELKIQSCKTRSLIAGMKPVNELLILFIGKTT